MLKSMTAFSRKERVDSWGTLIWEMRSVNHRYLDITVRLSEEFRSLEPLVRERLNARVSRGKLEVSLKFKPSSTTGAAIVVNRQLAEQVIETARELQSMAGDTSAIAAMDIFRWPGVIGQAEEDFGPRQKAAAELLNETIDDYVATREREGGKTADMLSLRCEAIADLLDQVREVRPLAVERQRVKLMTRLSELDIDHDTGRLEQELVYMAQRLDVEEELDRLGAHVTELTDVLRRDEPVGRRLDFLVQEFNREANTLGSKSADSQLTALAVDLKVLIEQMREQVQNIE